MNLIDRDQLVPKPLFKFVIRYYASKEQREDHFDPRYSGAVLRTFPEHTLFKVLHADDYKHAIFRTYTFYDRHSGRPVTLARHFDPYAFMAFQSSDVQAAAKDWFQCEQEIFSDRIVIIYRMIGVPDEFCFILYPLEGF